MNTINKISTKVYGSRIRFFRYISYIDTCAITKCTFLLDRTFQKEYIKFTDQLSQTRIAICNQNAK